VSNEALRELRGRQRISHRASLSGLPIECIPVHATVTDRLQHKLTLIRKRESKGERVCRCLAVDGDPADGPADQVAVELVESDGKYRLHRASFHGLVHVRMCAG
jgi:hypothetical protein